MNPKLIIFMLISVLSNTGLATQIIGEKSDKPAISKISKQSVVTLDVPDMYCTSCSYIVSKSLKKLLGVIKVEVFSKDKMVIVTYDPVKVKIEDLIKSTTNIGYPSTVRTHEKETIQMPDCYDKQKLPKNKKLQNAIEFLSDEYLNNNTYATQKISVEIYRLLSKGKPISIISLANKMNMKEKNLKTLLSTFPSSAIEYNKNSDITAFIGLSITPTKHTLFVDDTKLYTWCVFDGIFLPEILGKPVNIVTHCAATNETISVHLKPNSFFLSDPRESVMSITIPNAQSCKDNIRGVFCNYVNFFSNVKSYNMWKRNNKNTEMLTLEQACVLAKQLNEKRYKDINLEEKYD